MKATSMGHHYQSVTLDSAELEKLTVKTKIN